MQIWALIANVDDIIEQYGFQVFELKEDEKWYDVLPMDYANIEILNGEKLKVFYRGRELELPDAFWPMITNTDAYCLEHLLVEAGCKCLINLEEIAVVRSKVATYRRLSANGIPIPDTVVFFNHPDKETILNKLSYPFIVKPDNGYGGTGVMLIRDEQELEEYLSKLQYGIVYMAQEYIASSKGKDVRVIFFEGKYLQSILRKSSDPEEFRSNVHVGGEMNDYEIDEETMALCERIASLFDLPLVGIDLLFGEDGFVVTEINGYPGLSSENAAKVAQGIIGRFLAENGGGGE